MTIEKMKMSPLFIGSVIISIILSVFFLIILYEAFWPFKTIVVNQPVKVLTPKVNAGDNLLVENHYCKYTHATATLTRTLINDSVIYLQPATSTLETGCHVKIIDIKIPLETPAGTYYLKSTSEYRINPLRTIYTDSRTETFQVINNKD